MSPSKEPTDYPHSLYFVFGGPGAGKGTLCKLLAEEFNLAHICPGDLLRAAIKDEIFPSDITAQIQQAMKDGKLSPLSTILAVLHEELLSINSPVLIDGFPRCVEQMEFFEDLFGSAEYGLHFYCTREVMERRVLDRGQESNRVDDNVETLRKRFKQHEDETVPCVERLREQGRLIEVCTDGETKDVYEVLRKEFGRILGKN